MQIKYQRPNYAGTIGTLSLICPGIVSNSSFMTSLFINIIQDIFTRDNHDL